MPLVGKAFGIELRADQRRIPLRLGEWYLVELRLARAHLVLHNQVFFLLDGQRVCSFVDEVLRGLDWARSNCHSPRLQVA